jgi:hypothetical protein
MTSTFWANSLFFWQTGFFRQSQATGRADAWLKNANRDLDGAVADAYGWKADMSNNEMLTKLLAFNVARAKI